MGAPTDREVAGRLAVQDNRGRSALGQRVGQKPAGAGSEEVEAETPGRAPSATSITFTSEVYNKPAGKRKSLTTKVALKGLERGVTKPPLKKKRRR